MLSGALLGRSHRSPPAKARLGELLERSRTLLGLPEEHRIALVAGSDTGAFEMAMWSLLGARGTDVLAWESFGEGWLTDARDQSLIKEGAWIIVGSGSARAVAQVADIDDGTVHVRPLPGPVRRHAHLLGRSVA